MSASLLKLLTWLSPAFPVGGFSYSHGLETAIAGGAVRDRETLRAWIAALIAHGSGWTDAVLLTEAWRASTAADAPRLAETAELADAMAPSLERRRESLSQGAAFLTAARAWRPDGIIPPYGDPAPYCIAVGAIAAAHAVPLEATLTAWLHAFASNLASIALRAVPLGQTDGVAVLAALEPLILATAARAAVSSLDDLGTSALMSDIASMRHETLPVRLFIS
ncbi:MAG: urease accessory protein UreF [Caulobacter sp.]|nr:urease accessory protein UreF [Caulobacter sp.]